MSIKGFDLQKLEGDRNVFYKSSLIMVISVSLNVLLALVTTIWNMKWLEKKIATFSLSMPTTWLASKSMPFKVALGNHRHLKNVIVAQKIFGTCEQLREAALIQVCSCYFYPWDESWLFRRILFLHGDLPPISKFRRILCTLKATKSMAFQVLDLE